MDKGDIGRMVAEVRTAQGVSQREFARALGMHQTQLRRVENGETAASVLFASAAANALGVRLRDIIGEPPGDADDQPPARPGDAVLATVDGMARRFVVRGQWLAPLTPEDGDRCRFDEVEAVLAVWPVGGRK